MTDLNTIFIDEKDIAHLHLDLKRSCDEVKVKEDIFLDHTIPLFKDLIEKHNILYILKLSGSVIEEYPKYKSSKSPIENVFGKLFYFSPLSSV